MTAGRTRGASLGGTLVAGALLMLLATVPGAGATAAQPAAGANFVPGQVLVRFRSSADGSERAAVRAGERAALEQRLPLPGLELLDLPAGTSVGEAVSDLESRPEVAYAEPNLIYRTDATFPNDQYFQAQWGLDNQGTSSFGGIPGADVDAPEAWDGTTGSASVTVAVADSGAVFGQPDLAANLRGTGYDFIDNDADPSDPLSPGPARGHGTEVAGIIGAVGNNGIGSAGVNWNVGLEPLRVCTDVTCTASAIISAMLYARDQGVPVFNGSFGSAVNNPSMQAAIDASPNVLFVFSAGNDANNDDGGIAHYPCSYPSANIICVAATDQNDNLWNESPTDGSNYGATSVDLAAPGVNVLTTGPDFSTDPLRAPTGTSFSTPFVSGAAALVLASSPGTGTAQLKSTILGGVNPLASLSGKVLTGGRLNLANIVPHAPHPSLGPPDTKILKGPKRKTKSRKAKFVLSSSQELGGFLCSLDRGRFRPCPSSKRYKHLKRGKHLFKVAAVNAAGESDPTPAAYRWKVIRP